MAAALVEWETVKSNKIRAHFHMWGVINIIGLRNITTESVWYFLLVKTEI